MNSRTSKDIESLVPGDFDRRHKKRMWNSLPSGVKAILRKSLRYKRELRDMRVKGAAA